MHILKFCLLPFLFICSISSSLFATSLSDTCFVLEINQSIRTSADDAEERPNGYVSLNSSDIELINDANAGNQVVGLRFPGLALEPGAEIMEAYIQFTADDEQGLQPSDLKIFAEATGDAAPFQSINFSISTRTRSTAQVSWKPDEWKVPREAGTLQRTPDLKSIIQETVDRTDWQLGNAMAFIVTGFGRRLAVAYDLEPAQAARLVIKVGYQAPDTLAQGVYLNEVMPSNSKIEDEYGEKDDWVEIYNGGADPVFLGGMYMTDDLGELTKWQITTSPLLLPGQFALIWADGQPEQGGLHASFKLKKGGEELALVQEVNGVLHILDSLRFPAVPSDISYGRLNDGSTPWVFFGEASPHTSNNGKPQYLNDTVRFSQTSGHYSESFILQMQVANPSVRVHYTRDGRIPTEQDSVYLRPISITQTQLIQAKGFKMGFNHTPTTSEIFVLDEPCDLPILNVQSDPVNLWDDQQGMYVEGTNGITRYCNNEPKNWNQDWERPCHLTYIAADGSKGFAIDAGIKIGGACSRNFKMKSFNFFLRSNEYGEELLEYPLFPTSDITEYRRFKIRNSGNDWEEMLFRDGINQAILENTVDLDLMAYQPVRVYVNGAYWGVYGMRESFTKHYIASHHGVDPENVDILSNPYGPGAEVREGDFQTYDQLVNFVTQNDLRETANYQTVQSYIDLQEYINYHIVQIYLGNYDWPANNVRIWRDKNGGKFRWMLFDTDITTNYNLWGEGHSYDNTLAHALNNNPFSPAWPNGPQSTFLFRQMMRNAQFKAEFAQRMCTFRALIFASKRVHPMVDSMADLFRPELQRYMDRWKDDWHFGRGIPAGGTFPQWITHLNRYKAFFDTRPAHIIQHFATSLGLRETFILAFRYDDSTKGDIFIHKNEMAIPFNYQARYFNHLPITLKAVPHPGYEFSHWKETGDTLAETEFVGTHNGTLTPIFVRPMDPDTVVIDPDTMTVDTLPPIDTLAAPWQVSFYPNPVEDFLWVDYALPSVSSAELTLVNSLGQRVFTRRLPYEGRGVLREKISLTHLAAGVYWVRVKDALDRVYVRGLVVR